jgi:hypothetical protein
LFSIKAIRTEFDSGVEAVLGELKRTIRGTKLNPQELRQQTEQRLSTFASAAKSVIQAGDFQQKLAAFDQYLQFALRQFDVGFFDPSEPEIPSVANNSINIGTMTGSAIQQGSPEARQAIDFKLDVERATASLQSFEHELSKAQVSAEKLVEIAADIATIKAQLSKPSPSLAILREAGHSIRSVAEGIAAGVLTSPLVGAATALVSAIAPH